jgi:hypothetical protein
MPTVTISLAITGDTITAVSVTALTRSDTGLAPSGVSLPLSLSLVGGVWTGSFVDPATLPPFYNTTLGVTYSDSTVQSIPGVSINGGVVAGVYGDLSDISAEMGGYNTGQAADPDNAGDAGQTTLHEQKAIAFADSYINAELSKANFATPATVNLGMLKIIFGKLGAYQLYQVRGLQDKTNAFQQKFDWARAELEELLFMNRGGFTRASGYSDAPVAVLATVDADGRPVSTVFPVPFSNGQYWQW